MSDALIKKFMASAFRQEPDPTSFLSDMFMTTERDIFEGEVVEIDSVRGNEEYAVDVTPYSSGRGNQVTLFTRKEYTPPAYDELTYLTVKELGKVQPGKTEYQLTSDFANLVVDRQIPLRNKILRGREMLCRDALFLGKITLINGDVIDFKQKASHQYVVPLAWTNSTANPLNDFSIVGDRVRKNGKKTIADAVFGRQSIQDFLNNDIVKAQADLKQIERFAMTSPLAEQDGSKYHGTFSADDYKINVWTYPQFVTVPTGFSLPNEGTDVPYIPTDKIVVLADAPDFRLFYAANPVLVPASPQLAEFTGLSRMPAMARGKMRPYFYLDEEECSLKIGVKSRQLPVPVGIDQFAIMTTTPAP